MRRATICILTFSEYLPYFRRCLDSVLSATPLDQVESRIGFNFAPTAFGYALGRLCPLRTTPAVVQLPMNVERLTFQTGDGVPVTFWNSPVNLYKEPLCRLMYHDLPLTTEYVIWFDDDSYVGLDWWPALVELFDRKIDYIGQEWWANYLPGQPQMIQSMPWYRGVPFDVHNGRPGVRFMTGGFVAVRTERIRQVNFPDVDFIWKGQRLKQYGGDTLLGEIAHQQGWSRAIFVNHVKVNVDLQDRHPAPRRGGAGRQFGSDIDVALS